ncbi:hypothetical protein ABZ135_20050 [Streptomyces sp. NPDC006339]|uniref:hypothetical protein n=1 Tax=Streptomyces sp. NPDC006339 TaxID=3156755 RepID=UPI0033B59A47
MTDPAAGPALLGATVVLALLVIRTAVRETKQPGSARQEWAFLRDGRSLVLLLGAAATLGTLGWILSGPASLPWAGLAALLVASVCHKEG